MNVARASSITLSLSETLREETATLHREAEKTGIINDILRSKADRRGYAILLRNLYPVYLNMESALDRLRDEAEFRVFARPALRRADRISNDLVALVGQRWTSLPLLPAGERYAARATVAGGGEGVRLAAHVYVRYFGDLSGGQVLARLLRKSMDLSPSALSFYEFPEVADPKLFKDEMRVRIDDLGTDPAHRENIIDEAIRAFEHNIELSHAVKELVTTDMS